MSQQVTIKILSNEPYPIGIFESYALQDTTVGKSYQATLYEGGELCSDGVMCQEPTAEFIDDVGDSVFSFASSGRWEVV